MLPIPVAEKVEEHKIIAEAGEYEGFGEKNT